MMMWAWIYFFRHRAVMLQGGAIGTYVAGLEEKFAKEPIQRQPKDILPKARDEHFSLN
jgi:hypothetical protein